MTTNNQPMTYEMHPMDDPEKTLLHAFVQCDKGEGDLMIQLINPKDESDDPLVGWVYVEIEEDGDLKVRIVNGTDTSGEERPTDTVTEVRVRRFLRI